MVIDYAAYFLEVMTLIVLMDQATWTFTMVRGISIDKVIPSDHSKMWAHNTVIIFHGDYLKL